MVNSSSLFLRKSLTASYQFIQHDYLYDLVTALFKVSNYSVEFDMRLPNFFERTQKINSPYDKSLPTEKKLKLLKLLLLVVVTL